MTRSIIFILILTVTCQALQPTVTKTEEKLLKQQADLSAPKAIQLLTKNLTPKSSSAVLFVLATRLLEQQQPQQAISNLRQTLNKQPDFHQARLLLAQTYARQRDFTSCAQQLTTLLETPDAPRTHDIWGLLASAYAQTNQLVAAETAIRQAILLKPNHDPYRLLLLNILLLRQQDDQAASLAKELLPQHPHQELIWLAMLNPHLRNNRLEDANDLLTLARISLPDNSKLLTVHASVLLQLKLYQPAVDTLLILKKHHRLASRQALTSVRILLQANHLKLAKALLQDLPTKDFTPSMELEYQILTLKTLPPVAPKEQLERWLRILALAPQDSEASLNAARLHRKLQQPQQARLLLERSAQANPNSYETLLELANVYLQEQAWDKAKTILQKAYAIFPSQELLNTISQLPPQR